MSAPIVEVLADPNVLRQREAIKDHARQLQLRMSSPTIETTNVVSKNSDGIASSHGFPTSPMRADLNLNFNPPNLQQSALRNMVIPSHLTKDRHLSQNPGGNTIHPRTKTADDKPFMQNHTFQTVNEESEHVARQSESSLMKSPIPRTHTHHDTYNVDAQCDPWSLLQISDDQNQDHESTALQVRIKHRKLAVQSDDSSARSNDLLSKPQTTYLRKYYQGKMQRTTRIEDLLQHVETDGVQRAGVDRDEDDAEISDQGYWAPKYRFKE